MTAPPPTYLVRLARARAAGTYEHAREQLTDLLAVQYLTHAQAARRMGWATQTIRMAAWSLGISNQKPDPNETLIPAIRAYTASWDRGW